MVDLRSTRSTRLHHRWQTGSRTAALLLVVAFLTMVVAPGVLAKSNTNNTLQGVVPTITSVAFQNGQLLASGVATATINGKTYTAPFSGVPVGITLVPNQFDPSGCPVLDLSLGPINLNLLGLVVQTSPICLTITAYNTGTLGSLLCQVANLLNGGLTLSQILNGVGLPLLNLPGLTPGQIAQLLSGLQGLLNGALHQLLDAILAAIHIINVGHTCAVLALTLGPLDLNLLGLDVHLDNCDNGPVTLTITAVTGGNSSLLGNLLCQLLSMNLLTIGQTTLQDILNLLTGLLT